MNLKCDVNISVKFDNFILHYEKILCYCNFIIPP